ncbi:hypothetical protein, partial [Acinetobacter baumannii]|uniref:hypothetical protein n=1 Tax=Acinetobacter baumannii TaxID=470 RepID=UPI00287022DE
PNNRNTNKTDKTTKKIVFGLIFVVIRCIIPNCIKDTIIIFLVTSRTKIEIIKKVNHNDFLFLKHI